MGPKSSFGHEIDHDLLVERRGGLSLEHLFDRQALGLRDLTDEPLYQPGRGESELSRVVPVLEERRGLAELESRRRICLEGCLGFGGCASRRDV